MSERRARLVRRKHVYGGDLAGRGRQRVEPEFRGAPKRSRSQGLSVTEDDRAAPPRKSNQSRKSSKARGPRQRRRRSGIGRLFYWIFVLSIWGVVGVAGIVGYSAQMPPPTHGRFPDRAPNIKIVSVDGRLLANRGVTGGEAVGPARNVALHPAGGHRD